jgi:hypothetical protein
MMLNYKAVLLDGLLFSWSNQYGAASTDNEPATPADHVVLNYDGPICNLDN